MTSICEDILTFTEPETRWLSNMSYVKIEYDGIVYPSTENFYQAMKYESGWIFDDTPTRKNIRKMISLMKPHESKKFSKENQMTSEDFERNKVKIMLFAQRQKFKQEPFRTKLLNTGNCLLEEGNWWGDSFWGVDIKTREGQNVLGKLIMQVREEIRNESLF